MFTKLLIFLCGIIATLLFQRINFQRYKLSDYKIQRFYSEMRRLSKKHNHKVYYRVREMYCPDIDEFISVAKVYIVGEYYKHYDSVHKAIKKTEKILKEATDQQ